MVPENPGWLCLVDALSWQFALGMPAGMPAYISLLG